MFFGDKEPQKSIFDRAHSHSAPSIDQKAKVSQAVCIVRMCLGCLTVIMLSNFSIPNAQIAHRTVLFPD